MSPSLVLEIRKRLRWPAPATEATTATYRCPLCGQTFSAEEARACAVCPLLRRCGLVMCPHCSHELPSS